MNFDHFNIGDVCISEFLGSGVTLVFQEKNKLYLLPNQKKTVNFNLFVIHMGFVTLITLRFWHNIELFDESLNQLDVFPFKLIKMWNWTYHCFKWRVIRRKKSYFRWYNNKIPREAKKLKHLICSCCLCSCNTYTAGFNPSTQPIPWSKNRKVSNPNEFHGHNKSQFLNLFRVFAITDLFVYFILPK